jgi:hypothetical protein
MKRKLRSLKKLEGRIRFAHFPKDKSREYVWDQYFSTKAVHDLTVKYPILDLIKLNRQELKEVFEDFFYSVYFQLYRDMGLNFDEIQDPTVLSYFGLAPGASVDDIKKRFRELAKKHHPDHSGSDEKMIEILEAYNRLLNK